MHLTTLSTSPDGAPQPATGVHYVVTPSDATPPRYRLPLFLRITTGDADGVVVDHDQTALQATFLPLDYDALHPPSPLPVATLSDLGSAVAVAFDAPRRLCYVRLSASAPAGAGIECCRLDGNAISEKATVSANLQNSVATIPANADFTDLRFALRLKKADGSLVDLNPGHIAELGVRAYPTTPRLGLVTGQDLEANDQQFVPVTFMTLPGEVGRTSDDGSVSAADGFIAELERQLASLGNDPEHPFPGVVDIALLVESDAPCRIDITAFALRAYLLRDAFSPAADKVAFRFKGASAPQTAAFTLSPGATVHSASMRALESFGRDRVPPVSANGSSETAPDGTSGVTLDVNRWAVQQITSAEAITTTGVTLAILPLVERSSLLVEIQEDWQGSPSGKTVAAGSIPLDRLGYASWVTLRLEDPVTLPSRPHWLMVRAASGQAVWLTQPGDTPLALCETTGLAPLTGQVARYRFVIPATIQPAPGPVSEIAIGPSVLVPTPVDEDTLDYDLTNALNAYLASQPPSSSPVAIPITATSALPGLVTLYPPHITYDLDS